MFRLIRGEFRKIFLRPGIFIMTGLLILVLTIAPKLFEPASRTDLDIGAPTGSSLDEKYDNFLSIKEDYIADINEEKDKYDFLLSLTEDNPVNTLNELYNDIDSAYEAYYQAVSVALNNNSRTFTSNTIVEFNNAVNKYKEKLVEYAEATFPQIFTTKDNYKDMIENINDLLARISEYTSDIEFHENAVHYISNSMLLNNIKTCMSHIKNLSFSKSNLQENIENYYTAVVAAEGKLDKLETRMKKWMDSIEDEDERATSATLKLFDEFAVDYFYMAQSSKIILNRAIMLNVTEGFTDAEISKYMGFEGFNRYQTMEELTKNKYLLDNNTNVTKFSNPLAFNTVSFKAPSKLDYMYFVLEIMSFVIITYTVVLGAGMIASEQSSGTIKMLAIRPYRRGKIMFSKLFATMFFATVFMLITTLVAYITGIFMYKGEIVDTLIVFNANSAFTMSAVGTFFLYFLSLWIKVLIFVLIAFAISTLFKSYVGAVIISVLIYFLTTILAFVSGGATWLKYVPFANMDLYKYFGGAFVLKYTENAFLSNLFVSPVFADTSLLYSGIIVGSLLIILNLIIFYVFKNRDIN